MLDTRKIGDFLSPQKVIDIANKMNGNLFSQWRNEDISLVVSQLLSEHIVSCLTVEKNREQLKNTALKTGFTVGKKILTLSNDHNRDFVLFEVIEKDKLLIAIGRVGEPTNISVKMLATFAPDTVGFLQFSDIQINKDSLLEKVNSLRKNNPQIKEEVVFQTLMLGIGGVYLYLNFVEIEIVNVLPNTKYIPKKYEGFKNTTKSQIKIADISWGRETINNVPFGVVGHFRNIKVGVGRTQTKLIYVEPFIKKGYHKRAGKERNNL